MFLSFLVLWVVTVFIGSGLLFIAQPVVAKMLLPRLGGAPAVWTTSVLFFQAVLLAGLDLAPLLRAMARDTGLIVLIEDDSPPAARPSQQIDSRWAFLARSSEALRARGFPPGGIDTSPGLSRVWTDDRSDLWSLFLW